MHSSKINKNASAKNGCTISEYIKLLVIIRGLDCKREHGARLHENEHFVLTYTFLLTYIYYHILLFTCVSVIHVSRI